MFAESGMFPTNEPALDQRARTFSGFTLFQ